jgi:phenylpropionate dioxygenase-like ring-hydroxylating dioxygenase large terminal subunit
MLPLTFLLVLVGTSAKAFTIRSDGSKGTIVLPKSATVARSIHDAILQWDQGSELKSLEDQFNWYKAWYPIVPVEILDREKPHRFELLGQSIVVWNDGPVENNGGLFQSKKYRRKGSKRIDGTWRVFVDECPHRKVPLSEGRVEDDGSLLCSYHAWRYNGEGTCINVPQFDSRTEELKSALSNPKTSCKAFPTKVVDGVLYVWPSSDANAKLESELTPLPQPKTDDTTNGSWVGPWNYRELPYGSDFFFENVVDPAHVAVSHHNVGGNRYAVRPLRLATKTPLSKEGFAIEAFENVTHADQLRSTVSYVAPALVTIDMPFGTEGGQQTVELYASPSRPGFCNHVGRMVIRKDQTGAVPKFLQQFTLPLPKWLNHILTSAFLNQDSLFLHHQERALAITGKYTTLIPDGSDAYHYNKAIFAVPSDLGVISFRNWIRQWAGGRIPYRNHHVMPPASSDIVFDVWNAHTKYCHYCQVALKRLKVARMMSFVISASFAITRPFGAIGTLIVSFGLAGIGLILHKLIGMFYRYEYSHADND